MELRTFGHVDLRDDSGHDFPSIATHPKRLALAVYLCTARPVGFHRRDTLLALLWPELDQERARASLRKAVYHIRRTLGEEVIVSRGDDEIAINPMQLRCDVAEFHDALKRGDSIHALDVYRGAFLDGFFVSDAPGFEDWLERERRYLHDLAFNNAWHLAESAERNRDEFGAAHYARRAAALAPDDEGAIRRLVAMLDRLGDRAGALAAYEDFAKRLRRDFDVEPAVETRDLLTLVRTRRSDEGAPEIAPFSPAAEPPPLRRRTNRRFALAAVASIALVYAVSGITQIPSVPNPRSSVVAVLPFSYRGHSELSYLADGMVNLLSTNLDHIGEFRSVDAAAVLNRAAGMRNIDGDRAANLAMQLGAGLFVMGDIVEANDKLRVSAALYDARRNTRVRARATAEGDVGQLFEIIDRVTSQLLASDRRAPSERFTRLALLTTHSVPALKAYLEGEQKFRDGRYNESVELFQKAVQEDTTFALGYYRLALALMWGSNDSDRVAAEKAIRNGQRLAGPERALLEALLPFFRGDVDEAERQYRAILVRRPEESEVWYPLGEVLFHHNPARGRRANEARPAFEKALALGPKDGPLTHLIEIAAIDRNYVAFDSLFSGIQPGSHFYLVGEMMQALRSGDARERTRVLNALRDSSDARVTGAARHVMFLLEEPDDILPVIDLLTDPLRPHNVRSWGYVQRAHMAVSSGRPRDAEQEIALATPLDAARALEHHAWLASLPFVNTPQPELRKLRDRLQALALPPAPTIPVKDITLHADEETHEVLRAYLVGILSAQLGDYSTAAHAADALPKLRGTPQAIALASDLMHAVRAEILRVQGRDREALAEAERARIHFDANRLNGPPFFSQTRERYVRAQLLDRLARDEEALGWYDSFNEHAPWGRAMLAPAAFYQARIYEARGMKKDAARHYARFIGLWQNAEPPFQPLVQQAKQRLALLSGVN